MFCSVLDAKIVSLKICTEIQLLKIIEYSTIINIFLHIVVVIHFLVVVHSLIVVHFLAIVQLVHFKLLTLVYYLHII